MYSKRNVWPEHPGEWTSADGEYGFVRNRHSFGWTVFHRAHWNGSNHVDRAIGMTGTLNEAFRLAAQHYAHPVVPVDTWEYPS